MYDYTSRMKELISYRFCCSQVLITLALELQGCEDDDVSRALVRAVHGLCSGLGGCGKDCGALTGGVCVIGLFCGRGGVDESPHNNFNRMIVELVEWFEYEYGTVLCSEIIGGDAQKRMTLCPNIMESTFEKAVQIMSDYGVELD